MVFYSWDKITKRLMRYFNKVMANLNMKGVSFFLLTLYRVSQKKVASIEIRPFVMNVRCDTSGNLIG